MKSRLLSRFFVVFYSLILILFVVYSYSQIDLNLTLSSNEMYQKFQTVLIRLGYFNRSLSFSIFVFLIICLFVCYGFFLKLALQKKIAKGKILFLVLLSGIILFFSYSAFSSDIFNYMFDARIVTKYHLNPYEYKALDFSGDLWLRFMRWTHRTYPYGPLWLILTVPISFLGAEKFVPTFFLFKLFFLFSHFINTFLIYKIVKTTNKNHALFAAVFYGLNPLILVESVVSPHNDSVMLLFLLLSFYMLGHLKSISSFFFLLLSGGIKFSTWILAPIFFFKPFRKNAVYYSTIFMIIPLVVQIISREPYPWYFIPILGIIALYTGYLYIQIAAVIFSFIAIFQYAPYLLLGVYTPEVAQIKAYIFYIPVGIILLGVFLYRMRKGKMII